MKIAENVVLTETNYTFHEKVDMTFAEEANALLLGNLIKQYSNPYLAALREYTSNARDSHREAGVTRPIEVTLPNQYSPALIIEDFGLGLTREQLKGYGQFGKSTKRDSNEYTGGFGLGSKSALAMASQFTVTSVKNGKRNTVIIHRAENGAPVMGFPFPEQNAPGVPNGTKVTIPTSETSRFENAIANGFFLGWEPGTILIDGVAPGAPTVYNTDLFDTLPDGLGWELKRLIKHDDATLNTRQVTALINGVRYNLDYSQLRDIVNVNMLDNYLSRSVINLENGEVEIHPSRETLIYDKRTREYIQERIAAVLEVASMKLQQEISAAPTLRNALSIQRHARGIGFKTDYFYKGIDLSSKKLFRFGRPLDKMNNNITRAMFTGDKSTRSAMNEEHIENDMYRSRFDTYTVLVVGAEKSQNHSYMRESNGVTQFVRAMQSKGIIPKAVVGSSVEVYYTSHAKRRIKGHFKQMFSMVIDATDHEAIVSEYRKRVLSEARKGNTTTSMAGSLRISLNGKSSNVVKISDLDPETVHVLIHAEKGGIHEELYNRLGPRYRTDTIAHTLVAVATAVLKEPVVYVLVPASRKLGRFTSAIPNLVTDPVEFFNEVINEYADSLTEDSLEILRNNKPMSNDNARNYEKVERLYTFFSDKPEMQNFIKRFDKVTAKRGAYASISNDTMMYHINNIIESLYADQFPAIERLTVKDDATEIGAKFFARYPMLGIVSVGYWDLRENTTIQQTIADYILMVDKTKSN